ncbi:LD-carboxypeptidase [Limibacter armeniacum]|uniref:S66 peptidase family protein n=1 Tax=Limibacter armeniacum TaxID=466084 RepID=UPI002FE565D2
MHRRSFLKSTSILLASSFLPIPSVLGNDNTSLIKPASLASGDKVAVMAPAGAVFNTRYISRIRQALDSLGMEVVLGDSVYSKYGYLAGTDRQRAEEFNRFIADSSVKAIIAMRGGWGCSRMLPLINYELVKQNPKIVMGLSDITSLLLGLYTKANLVTFHGLVGYASWNDFSVGHFKKVVMENKAYSMVNDDNTQRSAYTIVGGKAEGILAGGNLTVLSTMLGSEYVPNWSGKILFLEDLNEEPYSIDRMLTHLKIAGVLDQINGLIFGNCKRCYSSDPKASFTIKQLLKQHIEPLGIPAYYGSNIGHISNKFTVPIGVKASIDADNKVITLLDSAMRP